MSSKRGANRCTKSSSCSKSEDRPSKTACGRFAEAKTGSIGPPSTVPSPAPTIRVRAARCLASRWMIQIVSMGSCSGGGKDPLNFNACFQIHVYIRSQAQFMCQPGHRPTVKHLTGKCGFNYPVSWLKMEDSFFLKYSNLPKRGPGL